MFTPWVTMLLCITLNIENNKFSEDQTVDYTCCAWTQSILLCHLMKMITVKSLSYAQFSVTPVSVTVAFCRTPATAMAPWCYLICQATQEVQTSERQSIILEVIRHLIIFLPYNYGLYTAFLISLDVTIHKCERRS